VSDKSKTDNRQHPVRVLIGVAQVRGPLGAWLIQGETSRLMAFYYSGSVLSTVSELLRRRFGAFGRRRNP